MKKLHLKSWSIITIIILFLSGCSATTATVEEEVPEIKEDAQIRIASVIYSKEKNNYNVEYTSNLSYDLEFTATLYDSEKNVIGKRENVVVEEDYDGSKYRDIEITPLKDDYKDLEDVDVYLELVIEADTEKGQNETFVYSYSLDGDIGGGSTNDVIEQYEDSEYVKVSAQPSDDYDKYTMTIQSDLYTIKELILIDSTAEEEDVQTSSYSADFLDYNTKYYEQFRNQMDLIASNFEILAMDGYGNQDIVNDLITWTSNFNGLLDVYETDSVPVNEMDQELHNHTAEMILEQRLVNENIINGLTEYDETYLLTAGEHLENVTDMYLEGYNLLDY